MDVNIYVTEKLAEARLREFRAAAARWALLASLRPGRRGIRVTLGRGLIRAGCWMLRQGPAVERAPGIAYQR